MTTVAFITLGCKVNQTETEVMAGIFQQRGYIVTDISEHADVYVVNTCCVTHLGERKSQQLVRRAIRENPSAIVAVTGCFAQISPVDAAAIPGVDVVIGTHNRDRIVDFVEEAILDKHPVLSVSDIMSEREFEDIPLQGNPGRTRAFLKIQDGCDNYCSYCIIPFARGHLRSRSLGSIARETRHLAESGFQEIVLTGINLGAYGREDGRHTLVDAVRTVLAEAGTARVRLSSAESLEISEELIGLMEEHPRMCPHLHLPLQSGEDSILAAMRRTYTAAEYANLVERLRNRVPDIAVTTDIIVGFPGETPESFQTTLEFATAMKFAKIHVFPFSSRVGTPAATFPKQVDEVEKKRRVKLLLEIGERSGEHFRQQFIGRTMPVLIEKAGERTAEGLTPNYQRVFIRSGEISILEKRVVEVELINVSRDGFTGRLKN